ncbi:MAG TPA: lycopene cyclase domain-containing protein [Saprospiraceae bacterium]|nr:lycopene cyclase domain-containing protein [Saprospiraceae bacterium]
MAHTLTSFNKKASMLVRGGFFLFPILLVAIQWATDTVVSGQLLMEVPQVKMVPWLESPYTYIYLHLFTVLPVLALSFDRNVHYYRKWRYLWGPVLVVGTIFIVWDVVFTAREVWGFNHDYLSGFFMLGLPIEEWLFFITVPFACVFIYECLNFYIKKDILASIEPWLTPTLIVVLAAVGIWQFTHMYTATTFILTAGFLLVHYMFLDGSYRSRFYLAYLVTWLPFILVNGVLTGGYTQEPIVIYNPAEYLGIRITSIPLDDSVYNLLLLLGVVTLFERNRKGYW